MKDFLVEKTFKFQKTKAWEPRRFSNGKHTFYQRICLLLLITIWLNIFLRFILISRDIPFTKKGRNIM